jgi:hypothetical protein
MQGNGNVERIKIRKSWGNVKPATRPHSTKKGRRGYDRRDTRRAEREAMGF